LLVGGTVTGIAILMHPLIMIAKVMIKLIFIMIINMICILVQSK
jgi:hypothetical protein